MKGTVVSGHPASNEHAPFYDTYTKLVPESDLAAALETQLSSALSFLRSIPESLAEHRYAPEKWSVSQVVRHVIDSERVFGFRAFWFARAAGTELPAFEQDDFIRASPSGIRLSRLASEFEHLRRCHALFFESLDSDAWRRTGIASGNPVSVRALAAIMIGHFRHHEAILRERYLGA
jgi:hypothetical protein